MCSRSFPDDIQINKKHWNEIAKRNNPRRAEFLRKIRNNYAYLDEVEPKISSYLQNVKGKRIIVPQHLVAIDFTEEASNAMRG